MDVNCCFKTGDLAKVEALLNALPASWPDAEAYLRTQPKAIGYMLIFDQQKAEYEPIPVKKEETRPDYKKILLDILNGNTMPAIVQMKKPTWNDEYGVPKVVAQRIALRFFALGYVGWVKFHSPNRNSREGFHLESLCISRHEDEKFYVEIEVSGYWRGRQEVVEPLIQKIHELGFEVSQFQAPS